MRFFHPKLWCLLTPLLLVVADLLLLGVNNVPDEVIRRTFPLSMFILFPFVLGYTGGPLVALASMLWAVACCFIRFEGKRPVRYALLLFVVSFVASGIFGDAVRKLNHLPLPPPRNQR
jgi:hypothetical protein